jgi:hypothetical protein
MTTVSPGAPAGSDADQGQLRAYLATALTALSPQQRAQVFAVSDVIASACTDAGISLYQPRQKTDPVNDPTIPDHEVFLLDRQKVRRSDLLIYLADHPSTGAGLELVFAHEALIPIVAIADKTTQVSRMVTGIPGPLFLVRYADYEDLRSRLHDQLQAILPSLLTRRDALSWHAGIRLGERIRQLRVARGMTHEDLARIAGMESFSPEQIRQWEKSSDLESNLSLVYLRQIAAAFGVDAAGLLAEHN